MYWSVKPWTGEGIVLVRQTMDRRRHCTGPPYQLKEKELNLSAIPSKGKGIVLVCYTK